MGRCAFLHRDGRKNVRKGPGRSVETRYRRRQRGAPRVQAIPGVEQASPPGDREQTTQLSVHSTQAGSGGPASAVGAGPALAPAMTARTTISRAAAMESVIARASSRTGIAQP
ncbi:hypothetical protein HPT29_005250 [Microvirga terrae]|uniref:Uncharacterized protein n=1 Tax=Microvirga terrae TaxID=2740529 RepID=A0ABY5RX54_9HYPH|nr:MULTISPECIES: hypothetical protein [Microvirga]MBQ0823317.1 hypothetical protein [Microvirga sp. HBU67558]UVF20544.1 hypothetical protein HPT29_005250 [Microvirga terrae]